MSREIKFRVWHKRKKKIFEVLSISLNLQSLWVRPFDTKGHINEELVFFSDVILMQYIGLKATNGEEICEGDIVRYFAQANNHGHPWGWEFTDDGVGVVRFLSGGYIITDKDESLVKVEIPQLFTNYEEVYLEVIGNIYENPELLKENAE